MSQRAMFQGPHILDGRSFVMLLEAFRAAGGTASGNVLTRLLEKHQAGDHVRHQVNFADHGPQAVIRAARDHDSVDRHVLTTSQRTGEVAAHV